MSTQANRYLRNGIKRVVGGWLDPLSARFIASISDVQRTSSIGGGVGEIGVWRGKLFGLLLADADPTIPSIAIDLFEDQHLNVDKSGKGGRHYFETTVATWGSGKPVAVLAKSSLDVTPAEWLAAAGEKARLVSVDGGHTAECAESDLRLAEAVLRDDGVAVMDDVFLELWPDVSVGVARYCLDPSTALKPFAITPNKVYFARPGWHGFYRAALKERWPVELDKASEMYGQPVDIYGINLARARLRWLRLAWQRVKVSPLGEPAWKLKKALTGRG